MKHPDDKRTLELPGVDRAKRGRPAKHSFGAMTAAERQKAYRARLREKMYVLDASNLSRVMLIAQLGQALAVMDEPPDSTAADGASWTASKLIQEIVTRYKLTGDA